MGFAAIGKGFQTKFENGGKWTKKKMNSQNVGEFIFANHSKKTLDLTQS